MKKNGRRYKQDLTDIRFGNLVAINVDLNKTDAKKRAFWRCLCNCGNLVIVRRDSLLTGKKTSCGCKNLPFVRKLAKPVRYRAIKVVHTKYKCGAKRRNISFDLSYEDVEELIDKNCHYCGSKPSNTFTRTNLNDTYNYNGIDRVDSNKGYTLENCVPCCWDCNQSKSSKSKDDFLNWVKRVYEFNFNRIER